MAEKAPKDPGEQQEAAEREEREEIEERHADLPRTEEGEGSGGTRTQTPDERRRDPTAPNVQPDPQTERPQMPQGTEETERQLTEMRGRMTATERENVQLRETVDRLNKQDRNRRFTDMVMGRGGAKDGQRWYGDIDTNVGKLERLADAVGEDSPVFKDYVEEHEQTARQLNEMIRQGPKGSDQPGPIADGSVQSEIDQRVGVMMREHPDMSLPTATVRVLSENPDLAERHRREASVRV